MVTLAEVMTRRILTVSPSTSVAEAATIMGERAAGSALVMEERVLVGIFTERDIVRALGRHFDAAAHPVAEWMTKDPVTASPETPVQEALQTMLERGFRHLPVLDEGEVVGVVSLRDLSRATSA
ncbi:MAG TPA: CBS domain-containing protein [Actinomycetota bacterium]|nr:CBS domain-containing protein [Actinomycetota bacterium]